MYAVFLYDMHDNEYLSAEEPHTDKALFVIILTSIFNGSDEARQKSERHRQARHCVSLCFARGEYAIYSLL